MIKKKKKKSFKKFVFLGLFFCLAGAVVYFLVWSPFFWVGEIRIEAVGSKEPIYYSFAEIEEITEGILENKLFYFIPQKSIVLASVEKIEKDILERFPEIKIANVSKKAPSILEIEIEERKGIGVWCQVKDDAGESRQGQPFAEGLPLSCDEDASEECPSKEEEKKIKDCFKIDRDGVIYRESPLISGNLVLNIYSVNSSAKIRDEVIPPKTMHFILTAKEELSKIKTAERNFPAVVNFEFVSVEELKAKTVQGWWIYFNPSISVNSQINTLRVVLDNEIKDNLSSLEYIDLIIEGRVYYK